MLCQADFLYDDVHKWCNYPDQVCCGERDCDGRHCNDNCEGGDFDCPSPNGFFEDPKNCAKYWQCNNDIAVSHMCDSSKSLNHPTQNRQLSPLGGTETDNLFMFV